MTHRERSYTNQHCPNLGKKHPFSWMLKSLTQWITPIFSKTCYTFTWCTKWPIESWHMETIQQNPWVTLRFDRMIIAMSWPANLWDFLTRALLKAPESTNVQNLIHEPTSCHARPYKEFLKKLIHNAPERTPGEFIPRSGYTSLNQNDRKLNLHIQLCWVNIDTTN